MLIEIDKSDVKKSDYVLLGDSEHSKRPETGEALEKCGLLKIDYIDYEELIPRIHIDVSCLTPKQRDIFICYNLDPYSDRFITRIKKVFREIDEEIILI